MLLITTDGVTPLSKYFVVKTIEIVLSVKTLFTMDSQANWTTRN